MDFAGRMIVHSESNSSTVDVEGGHADMRSSPAEEQRQEEEEEHEQQQGEETTTARETGGGGEEGDAAEEMVSILHMFCMQHLCRPFGSHGSSQYSKHWENCARTQDVRHTAVVVAYGTYLG